MLQDLVPLNACFYLPRGVADDSKSMGPILSDFVVLPSHCVRMDSGAAAWA